LADIKESFTNIHTSSRVHPRCTWSEFGLDRSTSKGYTSKPQTSYSTLTQLPLEKASQRSSTPTKHTLDTDLPHLVQGSTQLRTSYRKDKVVIPP